MTTPARPPDQDQRNSLIMSNSQRKVIEDMTSIIQSALKNSNDIPTKVKWDKKAQQDALDLLKNHQFFKLVDVVVLEVCNRLKRIKALYNRITIPNDTIQKNQIDINNLEARYEQVKKIMDNKKQGLFAGLESISTYRYQKEGNLYGTNYSHDFLDTIRALLIQLDRFEIYLKNLDKLKNPGIATPPVSDDYLYDGKKPPKRSIIIAMRDTNGELFITPCGNSTNHCYKEKDEDKINETANRVFSFINAFKDKRSVNQNCEVNQLYKQIQEAFLKGETIKDTIEETSGIIKNLLDKIYAFLSSVTSSFKNLIFFETEQSPNKDHSQQKKSFGCKT